ncbi:hypothetical protein, partial [Roseovarius sp. MBR-6]|uniref:hypothetical protein n=1 Tax=Roseovarius sp. MBR-6 TaxID=3156459 RepID=UPI003398CB7B
MTHQFQGQGQRFERLQRNERRTNVQPRTIYGIAHPGRQGPEEARSVLHQDRARALPTAAIAGVQDTAKKRVPRILDPQFSIFVCGMIADLAIW